MTTLNEILAWLIAHGITIPWATAVGILLMILGTLVDLAERVVVLTPTKVDDEYVVLLERHWLTGKILKVLKTFSIAQRVAIVTNSAGDKPPGETL